jgi:hypothetical protein
MYPLILIAFGGFLLQGWEHEASLTFGLGVCFCGFVAFMEQQFLKSEHAERAFMSREESERLLDAEGAPLPDPLQSKLQKLAGRTT